MVYHLYGIAFMYYVYVCMCIYIDRYMHIKINR